jgi:hypothetical protein
MHLLVPAPLGVAVPDDSRSATVTISKAQLVVGGETRTFVDLVCHRREFGDVFQRLVFEVAETIDAQPDVALTAPYDVLARWRTFFEPRRTRLSRQERIGLFGELTVLERLVHHDPFKRLDFWVGPTGATHDFTGRSTAIEVKTTTTREALMVEIHGAEQLQPGPGTTTLYLAVLKVQESAAGRTLGQLVADLVSTGINGDHLGDMLRSIGWDHDDDEEALTVVEDRWYEVDEAFPKIIPSSFVGGALPLGVLRLRYHVDLTGSSPAPLPAALVDPILRDVVGVDA